MIFCGFSAINPILYNAMSDKFRKAFRMLLICGRFNPARRSAAAAAMANTMATDLKSDMSVSVRNPHAIYYANQHRKSCQPVTTAAVLSRTEDTTAFALVELVPNPGGGGERGGGSTTTSSEETLENNHKDILTPDVCKKHQRVKHIKKWVSQKVEGFI